MSVLNLQVPSGPDDGVSYFGDYFPADPILGAGEVGGAVANSNARFTGVSGLSGATINSAVYRVYGNSNAGVSMPLTKVCAEDAAAPAQVSDLTDFNGRTLTTANVDWDTVLTDDDWNDSPDLSTVIQELADSYDPSAINIFHKDDGSATAHYQLYVSYDTEPTQAPKLDIDYTALATANVPMLSLLGVGA